MGFDYFNTTSGNWEVAIAENRNLDDENWTFWVFSQDGKNFRYPSVFGTGNYVYLAFEREWSSTDHDIGVFNTTDNGNTWKWSGWAAITNDDERYPEVLADGSNVYVFYLNTTTGYVCEVSSSDYGQTWSSANRVSDGGSGVGMYRTIGAFFNSGALYVSWTDNRNGNDDIYFDKVPEFNMAIFPLVITFAAIIMWERRKRFK